MITIQEFNSHGKPEVEETLKITAVDTGGSKLVDDKLVIKIWAQRESGTVICYNIEQSHFPELIKCLKFAVQYGYTSVAELWNIELPQKTQTNVDGSGK